MDEFILIKNIMLENSKYFLAVFCFYLIDFMTGIAKAIRYSQDETKFRYRHIGKVIELYNQYDRVKVLLDIE